MAPILIGLASCQEAHITAPVVRALLAANHEVRIAWFGTSHQFTQALALGFPAIEALIVGELDTDSRLLQASEFLNDEWLRCPTVLTVGYDVFATAIALTACERDALVIRLASGERVGDARDRRRRLADHAADVHCVASDAHRQLLLQEGVADESIAIVGCLTAAALAALPTIEKSEPAHMWVAFEHAQTLATHGTQLLEQCQAAAEQDGLSMLAASKHMPAEEQLRAARTASVIVTDSLGYQDFAAAAGIACIVMAPAGTRWDLLTTGAVMAIDRASELPQAVARGHAQPPLPPAPPKADAGELARQAIETWLQAPDTDDAIATDSVLPTEANATGRTFDDAEVRLLQAAVRSGTLNSTRGTFVDRFEKEFADWLGCGHAIACANGSAAVHCAIAALGLQAGDEVITTPITDMGALTPIFYEGAVPVFADVDPETLNVTAETIQAQRTDRTRAIIVTHLFGRPCEMDKIVAFAEAHDLPIIEDAAQAFGASYGDAATGTIGKVAAFSLQQGKHITTGEGGIVCTDDDEIARRVFLFVNKAWGYGDAKPDHYFPALNYRLTELQGAVACAQLPKLDEVVAHRRMIAADLATRLADLAGIACPTDPINGRHSYWKFALRVDERVVKGGAVALGARIKEAGVACMPRYVQKPAFECQLFVEWRNSPVTTLPLLQNPRGHQQGALFERSNYPGAISGLEQVIVLPINERYRPEHVATVADAVRQAHKELVDG